MKSVDVDVVSPSQDRLQQGGEGSRDGASTGEWPCSPCPFPKSSL